MFDYYFQESVVGLFFTTRARFVVALFANPSHSPNCLVFILNLATRRSPHNLDVFAIVTISGVTLIAPIIAVPFSERHRTQLVEFLQSHRGVTLVFQFRDAFSIERVSGDADKTGYRPGAIVRYNLHALVQI